MKTKLLLVALVIALATLFGQTHWRARRLQQSLDFQTASIKSMATDHAHWDLSRGSTSYYLLGRLTRDYEDAFASHFKDFGIRPVATGCEVTEALHIYSDAYNRVIRESLAKKHGKDLIQGFQTSYFAERNSQ